jgi:hypothetical protein
MTLDEIKAWLDEIDGRCGLNADIEFAAKIIRAAVWWAEKPMTNHDHSVQRSTAKAILEGKGHKT